MDTLLSLPLTVRWVCHSLWLAAMMHCAHSTVASELRNSVFSKHRCVPISVTVCDRLQCPTEHFSSLQKFLFQTVNPFALFFVSQVVVLTQVSVESFHLATSENMFVHNNSKHGRRNKKSDSTECKYLSDWRSSITGWTSGLIASLLFEFHCYTHRE